MAGVLVILALVLAYISTRKYKGAVRVAFTLIVAMFYFFVMVFFYLLFGRI